MVVLKHPIIQLLLKLCFIWWCWYEQQSRLWRITAQMRQKSTNRSLWLRFVSPNPYILLSNPICLLSNSSDCYEAGLIPQSSYLICLLSIAHYSAVACLLSALSTLLSYVSPCITVLTLQPRPLSSNGNGNGYGTFLQCLLRQTSAVMITSQVFAHVLRFKVWVWDFLGPIFDVKWRITPTATLQASFLPHLTLDSFSTLSEIWRLIIWMGCQKIWFPKTDVMNSSTCGWS